MGESRPGAAAKRGLDLIGSGLGLAVFAIPMALIWAAIRAVMGPPALFRQVRPGLQGEPFELLKFRTMRSLRGREVSDEERLTPIGRFLRRTSLDELPEFWNVARGDMSLVGPRPLLPQYIDRYTPTQARRHEVRPGITGWAQVNGRNATTWEERLALDVWYVDNHDLRLDLKILWLTLTQVVRRSGISAPGHATMPEFMGTEEGTR